MTEPIHTRVPQFMVYVAASFKEKDRAKKLIERLKGLGYGITHDWTDEVPPPTQEMAEKALNGAIEADLLVFLHSDAARGAWVEVGAALSTAADVVVVAEPAPPCVFFKLPTVTVVKSEDDAVLYLTSQYSARF